MYQLLYCILKYAHAELSLPCLRTEDIFDGKKTVSMKSIHDL